MKSAVVDANVFVYAAVGAPPFATDAEQVLLDLDEVWVPASVYAECVNALWQYVRKGVISIPQARLGFVKIRAAVDRAVPVPELWERALELAAAENHSPYDTLFVALAERETLRVVTFDRPLAAKFPGHCVAPAALLAPTPGP